MNDGKEGIGSKIISTIGPSSKKKMQLDSKKRNNNHSIISYLLFIIILLVFTAFVPVSKTVEADVGIEDVDPMVSEIDVDIEDGYYHLTIGLYDRNTWRAIDEAIIEFYRDGEVSRQYIFDIEENRTSLFTLDASDGRIVREVGDLYHGKTDLEGLRNIFEEEGYQISESNATFLSALGGDNTWTLSDEMGERVFFIEENEEEENLAVSELTYTVDSEKGPEITDQWLNVNTAFEDEPRDRSEKELTLQIPAGNHDRMSIEVVDQEGNIGQSAVRFRTLRAGEERSSFVGLLAVILTGLMIFKVRYISGAEVYEE